MSFQSYISEFTTAAGEIFSEPQSEPNIQATQETVKYDQLIAGM